jgi:hypothetical protein
MKVKEQQVRASIHQLLVESGEKERYPPRLVIKHASFLSLSLSLSLSSFV